MQEVYIIDAVRTPIGKYGGKLAGVRADDLFATTLRALMSRNPGIDPSAVEDVIAGDANQAGEDCRNVARMSSLLAGLPVSVGGTTVNRLCGSGMQAIIDAARAIACGEGLVYLAGGVESMTRAPFILPKTESGWARESSVVDSTIGWRFTNPLLQQKSYALSMGETADHLAAQRNISREEQDAFALRSHQHYFAAREAGKWNDEIIAVDQCSVDEAPRQTSIHALERLRPVFSVGGSVTAGNASGLNDGAAALILAGQEAVVRFGLTPMARVRSMGVAGVEPLLMGTGPIPATKKALARSGLTVNDIGLWEINESFAVQVLACMQDMALDPGFVNVNGGAIAMGNPLGCSGARICTTLVHEMMRSRRRFGVATTCVGVGQGVAIVLENLR